MCNSLSAELFHKKNKELQTKTSQPDNVVIKNIIVLFLSQEKIEKLEEDKKRRLQLYVFVSRCVAHPFNAKQPTDMTRRHTKLTPHQLETIQARFQVISSRKLKSILLAKTCVFADQL